MTEQRTNDGRFAPGHSGGPGRPRRAVESRYMAVIGDAVSLEDWQAIVQRACDDAKDGDGKAREWLAKYLVGAEPPTLLSIAANEQRQANDTDVVVDEVDQEVARQRSSEQSEEHCRSLRAAMNAIAGRLPQ